MSPRLVVALTLVGLASRVLFAIALALFLGSSVWLPFAESIYDRPISGLWLFPLAMLITASAAYLTNLVYMKSACGAGLFGRCRVLLRERELTGRGAAD